MTHTTQPSAPATSVRNGDGSPNNEHRHTVISRDGTVIAYDKAGQGPPVILVGGAMNTRTFGPNESLVPLLAQDFTVINYDRRGRGDSSDTKPYAVEREVEDIAALIDAVGGTAHLYGISSGGALALEAANNLSGQVERVTVYEVPYVVDSSRPPIPADWVARLAEMTDNDRRSAAVKYFFTKGVGLPAVFVAMMRFMPAWSHLKAVAHTLPYDAASLHGNGFGKPLDATQWARVTMPVLVMAGGKSPQWMQNAMRSLAATLPNATHHTLEGQTHIVKAKALAPALVEFFK